MEGEVLPWDALPNRRGTTEDLEVERVSAGREVGCILTMNPELR